MNFIVTYREKDGSRNKIAIEADDRAGVFPILRERGISAIRVEEGKLPAKNGRSKGPTPNRLKLQLAGLALLSLVAVALTFVFNHPDAGKISKTTIEEPELSQTIEKTSPIDEKPRSDCPSGWVIGPDADWRVFWNDALAEAKVSGKKIFVLSTGSDWCGWCKKLKQDVFEKDEFKNYAKKKLVLLYLDSPRKPLPDDQKQHNDTVRGTLSFGGGVPCAAVFGADSRRYGVISGYSKTPAEYIARIDEVLAKKGEMPKSGQPPKIFIEGYAAAASPAAQPKVAKRLLPSAQIENSPGPLSETVNGVTWFYETFSCENQTCAKVVPSKRRNKGGCAGDLAIPLSLGGCPVTSIGDYAFHGCGELSTLIIPNGVTCVGKFAFQNCYGLSSVSIASSVTNMGYGAFLGCEQIKSVVVPSCVKRIRSVFPHAYASITNVVLQNGAGNIGESAFEDCRGLVSVAIPFGVSEVGHRAFYDCRRMESVTLPLSVTNIGDAAFWNCTGLKSVVIPPKVSNIGRMAFYRCKCLASVVVPPGVMSVGIDAFLECDGLESVTMPSSVTNIGGGAFSRCRGIRSVTVPECALEKGLWQTFPDVYSNIVKVVVADGTTVIRRGSFRGCKELKSVTIPPSVRRIGETAFSGCSQLEVLRIPSSTDEFGWRAFFDCPNLKTIITSTEDADRVSRIEVAIGRKCVSEKGRLSVTSEKVAPRFSNSPLSEDSRGYKSETVDGVTWQYYVSNGVVVVEAPARIVGPARAKVRLSAIPDSTDGTVIVPDSLGGCPIVRIGESALEYCKNVTKVIMPSSVTSIGAEAFGRCESMSEVILPDAVRSIEQGAFSYCTNLVSVTVPAGLMHIGKGAFQGCRRLAGFTIPTNCVSIGARAFEGCDALGKMKIPAGVRRIGDGAFPGLQSFVVDEQNQTFRHVDGGSYDKTGTRMLGFPSTGIVARISAAVTNISESACKDLGSAKSIEVDPENRFYKSVGGCLYDKNGTVLLRCARSMSQLAIPNGVKRIGPHAFEANAELVEVSFPTSVVEIGECAFYACRGLTSVSLPANVTNISGCAFSYCTSLESVTIPSSVKHVGNHAFNRCKNLKSVVLKPGVESVGSQAFISCPKLSVVHLPSSVRRFGRMGAYRTFDVWGHYTLGPNAPRRSKEDGALTFVVEKGDEERVRNLLYDRSYERQCRAARDRGLLYPEIKVVTEEEWQGGKSPVKADKDK